MFEMKNMYMELLLDILIRTQKSKIYSSNNTTYILQLI